MATRLSSQGKSTATPNTLDAMRASAEARRCPGCGRKSAMKFYRDARGFGSECRWCKHSTYRVRAPL